MYGKPVEAISEAEYKEQTKVEWFGMDGALVLLYVVLSCIYGYGMIARSDFIVGVLAPCLAAGSTTLIFVRYLWELFTFGKTPAKAK